jgi:L-lactate dehydrogenase (cytochrome)
LWRHQQDDERSDSGRALALGAKACLTGRPWAFALATQGEAGVARLLATFRSELDKALVLAGHSAVTEISPETLIAY